MTAISCLQVPDLADVPHGFLGRQGGVSSGIYSSLNVGLGSDDDPAHVAENRRRAVEAVAPSHQLITLYQVHSALCVNADPALADHQRLQADALVTDRPGLLLGILTADCAPILLADRQAGVVGAAHAGWKGALNGVAQSTVAAMTQLGARAERICAVVGPCIARRSYEVDDAFRQRFEAAEAEFERFFSAGVRPSRHQFDLEGFVGARLADAGVGRVTLVSEDTYAQTDRFFSYRRTTHRAEADYGRQLSAIAVPVS